jgi:hypothetical protein
MSHLDLLIERLRHYDEVLLLELLDITSEELLNAFRTRVYNKRDYLYRELEVLEEPEEEIDELDGFQTFKDPLYDVEEE